MLGYKVIRAKTVRLSFSAQYSLGGRHRIEEQRAAPKYIREAERLRLQAILLKSRRDSVQ